MMIYKTNDDIELIRESSLLVCRTLAELSGHIKPGQTGLALDKIAEEYIRDHGAVPGFKGYRGFPGTLCISVNEQVVHGLPTDRPFESTDIISVDCGVLKNSFYGDVAFTFILKDVDPRVIKLCQVTKESLYLGIEEATAGKRVGDIGYAIQQHAEVKHRYGVVRELVGHGLGRSLHEDPEVSNFGKRGQGVLLKEGLVIAIEPMVNLGTKKVSQSKDGWTISSFDKLPSAHYEHNIAIRKGKADILSDHSFIENSVKNNEFLTDVSINF
ncbi:MAG: type I methionyl aminopeptidase [Saprospiraceae bacterium]|nr:type I methionyl aminopeptidase [Saprospiraceae bacterium]